MIRTQISLTEEQMEALRRVAADRGVSIAAVVRGAVDELIDRDDRRRLMQRALSVAGKYRDIEGATDVGRRHDDYLAEIWGQ
ncbi:MAG: ribbon-helix-helix protein, CopG family [Egibacteraceae bacterium]